MFEKGWPPPPLVTYVGFFRFWDFGGSLILLSCLLFFDVFDVFEVLEVCGVLGVFGRRWPGHLYYEHCALWYRIAQYRIV